jgi:uncharacterized Fe-S radical SAM superfamily protein PflX
MGQYHPCFKASNFPEIDTMLGKEEYNAALNCAREKGLIRLDNKDMVDLLKSLLQSV